MNEENCEGRKLRKSINEKLEQEFDALHSRIMKDLESNNDIPNIREMIRAELDLAQQIVREERALSGESPYLAR